MGQQGAHLAAKSTVTSLTKCVPTLIWLLRGTTLVVFAGMVRSYALLYAGHLDDVLDALGML